MENLPFQQNENSSQEESPKESKNINTFGSWKIAFKKIINRILLIFIFIFILYLAYNLYFYNQFFNYQNVLQSRPNTNILKSKITKRSKTKIKQFKSEKEFKEYLEKYKTDSQYALGFGAGARTMALMSDSITSKSNSSMPESINQTPDRISNTNIQVLSIDEADIVKNDSQNIYYSPNKYYYGYLKSRMAPNQNAGIKIIKAFPPAELKKIGEIDNLGDLFLYQDILLVVSNNQLYAYDVSVPEKPQEKWKLNLEENNYLLESRLYNGDLYLVIRNMINNYHPCPFKALSINDHDLKINCSDIYYPSVPTDSDSTFLAMKIDVLSGEIKNKISFIATANSSIVYMSENALYITYFYNKDKIDFVFNFLNEECSDLVSATLLSNLKKLSSYDISSQAKMLEMQILLNKFYASLSKDEKLKIENEFSNRMSIYYQKHIRELEKTGIVKIGLDNFDLSANTEVSGYPLNQFALDEYQANLRIATTIGERSNVYLPGLNFNRDNSFNDVYILDKNLKEKSALQNLGKKERIYSVRFMGDMAYLVTFRQTDPFYILDLSNPSHPQLKGELKIPGYSSYLHPLNKDSILGFGKEGSKLKLSLFDVSNPEKPQELDKYILNEYWSELMNNHHAFLLDKKHKIFFFPGSKGAYVFSYDNRKFSLVKALNKRGVKRAIYMNDYLYIIADQEISVFNENDWAEVNKLKINKNNDFVRPASFINKKDDELEIFGE